MEITHFLTANFFPILKTEGNLGENDEKVTKTEAGDPAVGRRGSASSSSSRDNVSAGRRGDLDGTRLGYERVGSGGWRCRGEQPLLMGLLHSSVLAE